MENKIDVALIKKDITYMKKGIDDIKGILNCTVKEDDDFKSMKAKVNTLWDERNKLIGWMLGAGLVGGVTGSVLKNIVSSVFASIK